uniref:Uncharacterized protein n=1 Tax=Paramormyrops kingsleyae TaxID=1676925 RepID=A0A3B3RXG7_9TELE
NIQSLEELRDWLICPICLDVLKNPVTTPCGHNYCMGCIKNYWDQDDDECRCPKCRQNFKVKPVLHNNTLLAEMLENLKTDKPKMSESESGDEECDTGVGGKIEAVKLNFGIHKITDDTGEVQGKICSNHDYNILISCFSASDACQLSLDHNTVHENLFLFNNDTEVIRDGDNYYYPSHPERFDSVSQILCKEGLSGCCYWEVQWSGEVYIGVSYKEIGRKGSGNDCCLGHNDKSWSLHCSNSKCCFRYNNSKTSLPLSSCPRIGVYLDHKGGILSFYRVSDIMTLIHRVQTTFTQPLYPGFRLFFPIFGSAENIITLCPLIE